MRALLFAIASKGTGAQVAVGRGSASGLYGLQYSVFCCGVAGAVLSWLVVVVVFVVVVLAVLCWVLLVLVVLLVVVAAGPAWENHADRAV